MRSWLLTKRERKRDKRGEQNRAQQRKRNQKEMGTKEGRGRGKAAGRLKEEESRGSREAANKSLMIPLKTQQRGKDLFQGSRLLHPSLMGIAKKIKRRR